MEFTASDPHELREQFWEFYKNCLIEGEYGLTPDPEIAIIAHCGAPVETGLFKDCVLDNLQERQYQAPLPLHDVGTLLLKAGENPASVDNYIKKYNLKVDFNGNTHHPLYDAYAALAVWQDLI